MFRQFIFVYLLFASFIGTSIAFRSSESSEEKQGLFNSNERIVVKAEPRMQLRTRRPIKFAPVKEGRWHK